jgi:hypothetical protein
VNVSRVIATVDDNGDLRVVTANISTGDELERLGLTGAKLVRIRQAPAEHDPIIPNAPPYDSNAIPAELRGRVGTVLRVGSLYKYDVTAQVRLHREQPGEARETLTLPLLWLEKHEG